MKKLLLFACLAFLLQLKAQQTEFWGDAYYGGTYQGGTIFKTDSDGTNVSVVHNFETTPGQRPTGGLVLANNGKLYGGTNYGGLYGSGVIFAYNPSDGSYEVIENLDSASGRYFEGSFTLCSNGKLYGCTSFSGNNYFGTIVEVDPATNAFNVVYHFGNSDGSGAEGKLVELESGVLYGVQPSGGMNSEGTLFKFDTNTSVFTKIIDFSYDNYFTGTSLVKGVDGKLYGARYSGQVHRIFEIDPSSGAVSSHSIGTNYFDVGDLINGTNGEIYGVTQTGGDNGYGVLYEYDPVAEVFNFKAHFNVATGKPIATPVQVSANEIMVITQINPVENGTMITKVNLTTGEVTPLDFFSFSINQPGSIYSSKELTVGSNGNVYGMSEWGGANNTGILFEYDVTNDNFDIKVNFSGNTEGCHPSQGLVLADNDKLYGIMPRNGLYGSGVIYEIDPATNTYTKKFDFERGVTGFYPHGLVNGGNGKLYGVTSGDGIFSSGKLFSYDVFTDTFTIEHSFVNITGFYPANKLMKASNGKLYGFTRFGGLNDEGVLFEFDPITNTYTNKYNLDSSVTGNEPRSVLFEASNGKLYGTTTEGALNYGALIEFDLVNNSMDVKHSFDYYGEGYDATGGLVEKENGVLNGVLRDGPGSLGGGILYEYNYTTDTFTIKIDFEAELGVVYPSSSIMLAENGSIYGISNSGGVNGRGIIYEYDQELNTISIKSDFSNDTGYMVYGDLLEIPTGPLGTDDISIQDSFVLYPNPAKDKLYVRGNEPITSIAIYDMSGKLVISENKVTDAIDISGLTPGLYMVQGYADDNTFYKKLIVE